MAEHRLIIISLHDGQAACSCGNWTYLHTGAVTREKIQQEFDEHIRFRQHIAEGKANK